MPIRHRFVFVAAVVIMGTLVAPQAFACSCLPPPPPLEALASAGAVFAGTVVSITPVAGQPLVSVEFAVDNSWKGVSTAATHLVTYEDSAGCGYTFEVGTQYLVYALVDGERAPWWTHLCSRTRLMAFAWLDLAALGPPAVVPAAGDTWGALKARHR